VNIPTVAWFPYGTLRCLTRRFPHFRDLSWVTSPRIQIRPNGSFTPCFGVWHTHFISRLVPCFSLRVKSVFGPSATSLVCCFRFFFHRTVSLLCCFALFLEVLGGRVVLSVRPSAEVGGSVIQGFESFPPWWASSLVVLHLELVCPRLCSIAP
jgi:hypothetical protein